MRTIRLVLEYDGTRFVGWQVQPNGLSVQEVVETSLARLTGETIRIRGASRTDSGVHARGQVATFRTQSTIPPDRFALALNSYLPEDVVALRSDKVSSDFDPRRHAKRKLYRYTIATGPVRPVLERHYTWYVKFPLNREAMKEAAKRVLGTHDFTSFSNEECRESGEANIRTLDRSELIDHDRFLIYEVEGRSFLYNMVRNLAGMLVDVGAGRFTPEDVEFILQARNRQAAGRGAPAKGLCLEWIQYDIGEE